MVDEVESVEQENAEESGKREKEIFTYCTGGIRCEKGVRFMQQTLHKNLRQNMVRTVYTLKGGIAAYIIWIDAEIAAGNKIAEESLFRGRNYVFDARGSIGLSQAKMEPVSKCLVCSVLCDRFYYENLERPAHFQDAMQMILFPSTFGIIAASLVLGSKKSLR